MKFGHEFKQHLLQDGFPPHWVQSAISYGQLKKCIKRVQRELTSLGLDPDTLARLLATVEQRNAEASALSRNHAHQEDTQRPVQYLLTPQTSPAAPTACQFHPKLLFAIDDASGEPLDARLAPETKQYLHQLAVSERLTDVRITEEDGASCYNLSPRSTESSIVSACTGSPSRTAEVENEDASDSRSSRRGSGTATRLIEVPLTSDSEFFSMLQTELSGLAVLQETEQKRLNALVNNLSTVITKVTQPNRSSSKADLAHWRRIFELYLESRIFFATNEQDHGAHDSLKAEQNLRRFQAQLREQRLDKHFARKESLQSLEMFMELNGDLLRMLKFQEINRTAMTKILKKFDKRTSLDIKNTFPKAVQMPALSENVAKAVCYQVSTDLLTVVPQLDDYLCPVCFSISYKPIRLRCLHVFCIRCLVVMQREHKDRCPLCRGSVVMEADSTNIDAALANFLRKFFPEETKIKQKENEHAAGVDLYGEAYNEKCSIM